MNFSPELKALGTYLAGEFDNQPQAMAEPIWYVHLRLWLRPIPLFREDSVTFFAEQANIVKLDQPYRPRIIRLRQLQNNPASLEVQYYMLKDIKTFQGGGRQPEVLKAMTPEDFVSLPSCTMKINIKTQPDLSYEFSAFPNPEQRCTFTYQDKTYQVYLGFEVNQTQLLTYDKGIDPNTGSATWGALLGPYRYGKLQDFSF